jgi:primase-polymerase (primpol)-like protein
MYDNARFATFTGRHIDDTPETIKCRPNAVEGVHLEYVDDPATDGDLPDGTSEEDLDMEPSQQGAIKTLGPANRNLVRRARRADDDFDALWGGDTSLYSCDNSRADFALLCKLAWWTESDLSRMERIFRASGLMRQKFDRELAGTTYGLYSAQKAIRKNGR